MRGVASGARVSLTLDDDTALANNARYISAVVPELSANLQVQQGNQNVNVNIVGTTPAYVPMHAYTITAGRMFTAGGHPAGPRVGVGGGGPPRTVPPGPRAAQGQGVLIRRA